MSGKISSSMKWTLEEVNLVSEFVSMFNWFEGNSYIYIYIYTPKPGRSPTRQYSVLSCFFPSRPASDFFLDFKKHFLLAVWTRVTLGLGMCKVCTEAVHSVALWTRVTLGLGMCKVCTEAVHSVALWTRVTLGLGMCKVCTEAVHCVALWTRVTLGLGMCKVCTEAVHCVALWTRVTLQVWTCVKYVPHFEHGLN